MKKVFISHPLSGNINGNRDKEEKICKNIINNNDNIIPISPLHLFNFLEVETNYREYILNICFNLIKNSDEVWFYYYDEGNPYDILSNGQKKEYKKAIAYGIPTKFIKKEW